MYNYEQKKETKKQSKKQKTKHFCSNKRTEYRVEKWYVEIENYK